MKKQLYLYLFILTGLFLIFTYSYHSKALSNEQQKSEKLSKSLKSQIQNLNDKMYDADYFSLLQNQRSQDYFEQFDYNEIHTKVTNDLLAFNDLATGNPYTGQEKTGDQKFIINKIKILNHRWIIADYSNGELWGDVVIKYFVNEDKSIEFKVTDTFIYPKEQY